MSPSRWLNICSLLCNWEEVIGNVRFGPGLDGVRDLLADLRCACDTDDRSEVGIWRGRVPELVFLGKQISYQKKEE
jgi:hypothetical protein